MSEQKDISEGKLMALPLAIWMPGEPPSVYHGSPEEMVASMAREMGEDMTVRETVDRLCAALAAYRHVVIGLPEDVEDDTLARLFVFALLDMKLARPLAAA